MALPTSQDYALLSVPAQAHGAATVTVTRRSDSDRLDCTPTDIVGGKEIAVASCRLAMMKMGWITAMTNHDGRALQVPVLRVLWEPAPASFDGDLGGTTPLAMDGKAPIEGSKRTTDSLTRYTSTIDATGHPTSCTITQSSGQRAQDEKACLIAMGQRYLPALDAQGQPTGTQVRSWVRWRDRD